MLTKARRGQQRLLRKCLLRNGFREILLKDRGLFADPRNGLRRRHLGVRGAPKSQGKNR